jgi:hypothetical protein
VGDIVESTSAIQKLWDVADIKFKLMVIKHSGGNKIIIKGNQLTPVSIP